MFLFYLLIGALQMFFDDDDDDDDDDKLRPRWISDINSFYNRPVLLLPRLQAIRQK